MTGATGTNNIGLIDSGNTLIQVPESVYQNILNAMQEKEKSTASRKIDG